MARVTGPLVAAVLPVQTLVEESSAGTRETRRTLIESEGAGVWLTLSAIGVAVPLALLAIRSLTIRRALFALAAIGVLLAMASVGVFYVPWLPAMIPALRAAPSGRASAGPPPPRLPLDPTTRR